MEIRSPLDEKATEDAEEDPPILRPAQDRTGSATRSGKSLPLGWSKSIHGTLS
jgi:hypothetical protein